MAEPTNRAQQIRNAIALLVIVVCVGFYVFFRVPAVATDYDAMEPAYAAGHRVLVNIRARSFAKGADVYYRYTFRGETQRQLGRVRGAPGDLVLLDKTNQSIWDLFEKTIDPQGRTMGRVPAGKYYVLRLNEDADFVDSRKIGLIAADDILGKAVLALPF
ncbi:MAG: hypothetical protein U0610_20650 [bacterium]